MQTPDLEALGSPRSPQPRDYTTQADQEVGEFGPPARSLEGPLTVSNASILDPVTDPLSYLSPRFWVQPSVPRAESIQEACLLRYYVESLAHWVRTCRGEACDVSDGTINPDEESATREIGGGRILDFIRGVSWGACYPKTSTANHLVLETV